MHFSNNIVFQSVNDTFFTPSVQESDEYTDKNILLGHLNTRRFLTLKGQQGCWGEIWKMIILLPNRKYFMWQIQFNYSIFFRIFFSSATGCQARRLSSTMCRGKWVVLKTRILLLLISIQQWKITLSCRIIKYFCKRGYLF